MITRKQLRCQIKQRAVKQLKSMDNTLLSLLNRQIGSLDTLVGIRHRRFTAIFVRNRTGFPLHAIPGRARPRPS